MCDTRALITTKQTNDLHSCWIIYTKSDGKERLTVTDTKPVMVTATSQALATDLSNNNNNSNGHANADATGAGDDDNYAIVDVEDNDGTDQSLADMLDPELQPEPPIANNEESQAIYSSHRHMAKEYLRVDTNLYYAQDFKEKLILQMDRAEREQKQELLRKIKDKEGLQSLYNNLKQQWEKHPARQADSNAHLLTGSNSSGSHVLGGSNQDQANSDTVADDGWVVIAPQHNT